jgi:hypothetical protein
LNRGDLGCGGYGAAGKLPEFQGAGQGGQ